MLAVMKNALKYGSLMLVLITTCSAYAVLYRGVDAEGKVVYSDTPFEDAEKFTPPPISVVDTAKAKTNEAAGKTAEEEKPVEFKYRDFDIVSPKNRDTIRDQFDIAVSLKLKPSLNVEQGHSIWLLVNGKPVIKKSKSLSLKIDRLERGAQNIHAQVRDKEGKVIVRTRTTVVFIHPPSAR